MCGARMRCAASWIVSTVETCVLISLHDKADSNPGARVNPNSFSRVLPMKPATLLMVVLVAVVVGIAHAYMEQDSQQTSKAAKA